MTGVPFKIKLVNVPADESGAADDGCDVEVVAGTAELLTGSSVAAGPELKGATEFAVVDGMGALS